MTDRQRGLFERFQTASNRRSKAALLQRILAEDDRTADLLPQRAEPETPEVNLNSHFSEVPCRPVECACSYAPEASHIVVWP